MRVRGMSLLLPYYLLLSAGCTEQPATDPEPVPVQIFKCTQLLIGLDTGYCREDITGPGVLSVRFQPDPKETSWEISLRGLAALAEQCEFRGQFDQTRLSALQGRGETEIVCHLGEEVDRQYHELSFANQLQTTNTAITVTVTFSRP